MENAASLSQVCLFINWTLKRGRKEYFQVLTINAWLKKNNRMVHWQTCTIWSFNDWQRFCVSVFFVLFYSWCKLIIPFKNQSVGPDEVKTMAAILWIMRCQNCSDNSTGRTENWWRETWNYFKSMVSRYLNTIQYNTRPLHASSPRLPDTVGVLYKRLGKKQLHSKGAYCMPKY